MTVRLTVNGKAVELDKEMPLPAFLEARKIDQRHIAVARNGDVIERDGYGDVVLCSGDVIEIVRMVGGG
jgi:thiamine biosynthesis protein ThiS